MIPSTKKQRQLIGIGCNQLGIDKETKAAMLAARFNGKTSTTQITKSEADDLLRELTFKGFKIKRKGRRPAGSRRRVYTPKNTIRLASRNQHEKIAALANLIEWRVKDGLTRWLEKRFTIQRVKTAQEAYKVIEGLKKMFENQMKAANGEDWPELLYDDPDINRYIEEHLTS